MQIPGIPGLQVSNDGDIMRMIQDLHREMREMRAANPFATMGITPQMGGIDFGGNVEIDGSLNVGGTATFAGSTTIGGNAAITGTLALPAGIIGNDALTNPVQIGTASNGINNYAIGTTSTVRTSVTLTVPAGFTQAIVIANATAMGQNSTSSSDYLYVAAIVQGINGGELYTAAPAGLGAGLASPFHTTLTGLTGGQKITVGVATRAGLNTWAAATSNQANIYATALYLR